MDESQAAKRAQYYSGTSDSNGTPCCSNCGETLTAHETRGRTVGDSRYRQGFLVCPSSMSRTIQRLEWIPVLMSCGHFELRLTRWSRFSVEEFDAGRLVAGAPCTQCDAQGRPVITHYTTLADAQAHITTRP